MVAKKVYSLGNDMDGLLQQSKFDVSQVEIISCCAGYCLENPMLTGRWVRESQKNGAGRDPMRSFSPTPYSNKDTPSLNHSRQALVYRALKNFQRWRFYKLSNLSPQCTEDFPYLTSVTHLAMKDSSPMCIPLREPVILLHKKFWFTKSLKSLWRHQTSVVKYLSNFLCKDISEPTETRWISEKLHVLKKQYMA